SVPRQGAKHWSIELLAAPTRAAILQQRPTTCAGAQCGLAQQARLAYAQLPRHYEERRTLTREEAIHPRQLARRDGRARRGAARALMGGWHMRRDVTGLLRGDAQE